MFKTSATSYEPCKWPSTLVSLDKNDGNFKFLHHGTPWGLSTRQRIALVAFRPFMEKLFYKNALPHKCPIMFDAPLVVKLEATSIQLSLKVIIINSNNHQPHFFYKFHNSLPPPHGLIFKGRPSNHKISWVRISIFLILTSLVTNPLHPNIIMHTLHTVLYIFSRF